MAKNKPRWEMIARHDEDTLVPLHDEVDLFELNTSHLHHGFDRHWIMTIGLSSLACVLLAGTLVVGLFGRGIRTTVFSAGEKTVVAQRDLEGGLAYPAIKQSALPYSRENTRVIESAVRPITEDSDAIATLSRTPPPEPVDETFPLSEGATISAEMIARGVPKASADALSAAIDQVVPLRQIKTGTKLEVTFDRQIDFYGREVTLPVEVSFDQPGKGTVSVEVDEDGQFVASLETDSAAAKQIAAAKPTSGQSHTIARIGASLSTAAHDSHVPDYIVAEFTRTFSYDVDFQRQVKPTDSFEMFYGSSLSGTSAKRQVLHMARLTTAGTTRSFYRFTASDGTTAYYDDTGHSASRALLRTPVSGARLTSGFGVRIHPLLGFSKLHTGVDFGAPIGTPIRAAGDGIIDQAGRERGYGNTIIIAHNDHMITLYGHMSRFAPGIHAGVHVNQGQVIGFVGSTGRSTGPHLHYEVRFDNKPVNPLGIRGTGGTQLEGKDLANFKQARERILAMMEKTPAQTPVGQVANP